MTSYTDTILPPRESRGLPRWGIAVLVVLAMHLAVGAFFILTRKPDAPAGAPSDTVMIDLAPVAAAPSTPQQETAPPPQEEPKPEPKPKPPPPPPPPEPPLQSVPETPPVMAAPPQPAPPVPAILQAPDLPPAPKAEAVLPPKPVAPPPPPQTVPDKRQEQKRLEQQKRADRLRKEKEKAERLRKDRAARARAASARHGPPPGASRESMSSWASQVQARVNAAKRYPEAARARGDSGTATLAFTVDAGGRVVSAHIAKSSGSSALDGATLAMAHRLGHLPPPPNGRVTLRVRVSFSVR